MLGGGEGPHAGPGHGRALALCVGSGQGGPAGEGLSPAFPWVPQLSHVCSPRAGCSGRPEGL